MASPQEPLWDHSLDPANRTFQVSISKTGTPNMPVQAGTSTNWGGVLSGALGAVALGLNLFGGNNDAQDKHAQAAYEAALRKRRRQALKGPLFPTIPDDPPRRPSVFQPVEVPRIESQLPDFHFSQSDPLDNIRFTPRPRPITVNPNGAPGIPIPTPQHTAEELKRMFNPPRRSALQNLKYPFEPGAAWRMMPPQPTAQAPTSPWAAPSLRVPTPHLDNPRSSWRRNTSAYATKATPDRRQPHTLQGRMEQNVSISDKPVQLPDAIAPTLEGQKVDLWYKLDVGAPLSEYETQVLFAAIEKAKTEAETPDEIIDSEYADELAQEQWVENQVNNALCLSTGHVVVEGLPLENDEAQVVFQLSLEHVRETGKFPTQEQILKGLEDVAIGLWNFAYGDDINTLLDPNAPWWAKTWAAAQFFPVMKFTKAFNALKFVKGIDRLDHLKRFRNLNPVAKVLEWSPGPTKNRVYNAYHHYRKHVVKRKEFPELPTNNPRAYFEATHKFLKNPPNGTELKILSDNRRVLYHEKSNTILFVEKGQPQTMFRPSRKRQYFLDAHVDGDKGVLYNYKRHLP